MKTRGRPCGSSGIPSRPTSSASTGLKTCAPVLSGSPARGCPCRRSPRSKKPRTASWSGSYQLSPVLFDGDVARLAPAVLFQAALAEEQHHRADHLRVAAQHHVRALGIERRSGGALELAV